MTRTPQDELEFKEWEDTEKKKDDTRRRKAWKKIEAEKAAIDEQLKVVEAMIRFLDERAKREGTRR